MKASLVSATSLAALLAFESGALAGPTFDLSGVAASNCNNVASPSNCTLTFYALPGAAAVSQTITLTADKLISGNQNFAAAPTGFSGAASNHNSSLGKGATWLSNAYGFTGGSSAGTTGKSTVTTGTTLATSTGTSANQTSTLTFNGFTVAPIESVATTSTGSAGNSGSATSGNLGYVLVTQTGSATVTVQNKGAGNLAGTGSAFNLNGSISASAGTGFSNPGAASVSLNDFEPRRHADHVEDVHLRVHADRQGQQLGHRHLGVQQRQRQRQQYLPDGHHHADRHRRGADRDHLRQQRQPCAGRHQRDRHGDRQQHR